MLTTVYEMFLQNQNAKRRDGINPNSLEQVRVFLQIAMINATLAIYAT